MTELSTPPLRREKFRPFRHYTELESRAARRKKRAIVAFLTTIIILSASIYGYVYYNSFFEKTQEAHLVTQSSPLLAKVGGKIVKVFAEESQAVKAGDPLYQVDPREFQATYDQRQRELDRSEERLAGAKTAIERLQQKLAEGGDAARERYEGSRAWYLRLQTKTRELRESTSQAQAALKSTVLHAPADGHIAQKMADVGATVTTGQPLAQFVGLGRPWAIADFKEVQIENIVPGQIAEITVTGIARAFTGKVESMSQAPNSLGSPTPLEKFILRHMKGGVRVPVKLELDADSLGKDANRLVNGSPAEVKVFIKSLAR